MATEAFRFSTDIQCVNCCDLGCSLLCFVQNLINNNPNLRSVGFEPQFSCTNVRDLKIFLSLECRSECELIGLMLA